MALGQIAPSAPHLGGPGGQQCCGLIGAMQKAVDPLHFCYRFTLVPKQYKQGHAKSLCSTKGKCKILLYDMADGNKTSCKARMKSYQKTNCTITLSLQNVSGMYSLETDVV